MRKTLLASSIVGLGMSFNTLADVPSVAVDVAPLHSLVSQVMEGIDQPDLLIPSEASPHAYSLRPSQAKALSDADVVFWIGEELTPWLDKALNNVAGSAQKVAMLDLALTTYEFREGATFEGHAHHEEDEHGDHEAHNDHREGHDHEEHDDHHGHEEHGPGLLDKFLSLFSSDDHDHAEAHHDEHHDHENHAGHDHEGIDPHAWLDPENAKAWIIEIKKVLSKHDPDNADKYQQNANQAIAELDKLISDTSAQIKNLGDLKFIVFHDAYQYFEKRFGISAAGSISLSDAEDPSPARITEIRDTVQKLSVSCVFAEPQYDPGIVNNVFEGSNTTIGVIDPLGAAIKPGNQHYSDLIKGMLASLTQCVK